MHRALALALLALSAPQALSGDRSPVAYVIVDSVAVDDPLTDAPGDPTRGAAVAADPAHGCIACHDGTAAPMMAATAAAPEGRARLAIIDLRVLAPDIDGHAFYDIDPALDGEAVAQTRLTAQEVEDLLAWLDTLAAE
jgi:hypothetical protein